MEALQGGGSYLDLECHHLPVRTYDAAEAHHLAPELDVEDARRLRPREEIASLGVGSTELEERDAAHNAAAIASHQRVRLLELPGPHHGHRRRCRAAAAASDELHAEPLKQDLRPLGLLARERLAPCQQCGDASHRRAGRGDNAFNNPRQRRASRHLRSSLPARALKTQGAKS
jgi:hypothetical protein